MAQKPTEFNAVRDNRNSEKLKTADRCPKEVKANQDPRIFRPMHANVTVVLLDIKAELVKVR